jgi:hypothetical protein
MQFRVGVSEEALPWGRGAADCCGRGQVCNGHPAFRRCHNPPLERVPCWLSLHMAS